MWRVGGRYGETIAHIVYWLRKAQEVCENEQQQKVIGLLISYYETGDPRTFDDYCIAWVDELDGQIDFINGFIEVYGDPLALKGSWEGLVEYKDMEATKRTQTISRNAQWFEDHSPVDPRFRKPEVKGVTANVICAAMLGGDEYPSTAIGINLPNADWIRASMAARASPSATSRTPTTVQPEAVVSRRSLSSTSRRLPLSISTAMFATTCIPTCTSVWGMAADSCCQASTPMR